MTKKIFLITFLISSMIFSQDIKGIISFNDGTKKEGFVSITKENIWGGEGVVKYQENDENEEKFKFSEIRRIDYVIDRDTTNTFYIIKEKESGRFYVVTLEYKGEVCLYKQDWLYKRQLSKEYEYSKYFLKRKNENMVNVYPTKFSNIKSAMKKYFSDCPSFVDLIDRNAFENLISGTYPNLKRNEKLEKTIFETIMYYNSNCIK